MLDRQEHLAWCKGRALKYLDAGDLQNAIASMMSDMNKHPETELDSGGALAMLGMNAVITGDQNEARRFIEGFN